MSETKTHFGKLKKVELTSSLEEWCKEKCNELGIQVIAPYNISWEEELRNECYDKYFFYDGEVWEIIEHIEESDGDIDILIPNEDGTITFVQQFYNGGTCLSECIEGGLGRLKKNGEI